MAADRIVALRGATRSDRILAGTLAGLVAGVVMKVLAGILAGAAGAGFFAPLELIAATFLDGALPRGANAILLGLVLHLAVSALWGAIFGTLLPPTASTGAAGAFGGLYGLGVFLIMTYLVLPWANPLMYTTVDRGTLLLEHAVFGVTLALTVPLARRLGQPAPGPALPPGAVP